MQESPNWINFENPFISLETNLHFLFSTDGMGEKPGKFFFAFFPNYLRYRNCFFSLFFPAFLQPARSRKMNQGNLKIIWTSFFPVTILWANSLSKMPYRILNRFKALLLWEANGRYVMLHFMLIFPFRFSNARSVPQSVLVILCHIKRTYSWKGSSPGTRQFSEC